MEVDMGAQCADNHDRQDKERDEDEGPPPQEPINPVKEPEKKPGMLAGERMKPSGDARESQQDGRSDTIPAREFPDEDEEDEAGIYGGAGR
jgi:hypothetical protein